ncbi:MerR family DNA-binding transcriptional regulator [Streptomyces chryseus]
MQTLRYYERRGLRAEPERSNGGHRLYELVTRSCVGLLEAWLADEVAGQGEEGVVGFGSAFPSEGLSSERCNRGWFVGQIRLLVGRPLKVVSKAWRARFQRVVQRLRPVPVGSRESPRGRRTSERRSRRGSGRGRGRLAGCGR